MFTKYTRDCRNMALHSTRRNARLPQSVKFLGHIVDKEGIRPDPEKVKGINDMTEPKNLTDLQRFLGMCNQLNKFSPQLTDRTKPLRDYLYNKNQWLWGEAQQKAFVETKKLLALYQPLPCMTRSVLPEYQQMLRVSDWEQSLCNNTPTINGGQ